MTQTVQELVSILHNTTAEAVLLGYQIRAPQSHRRGAADLIRMGLWTAAGQPTEIGEQVIKEIKDQTKALSEQDLPLEEFFKG